MIAKTHEANRGEIAGARTAPPPQPQPEPSVTLKMPLPVAETLMGILFRIGGPLEGRRGHAQQLLSVLSDLDVKSPPDEDFPAPTPSGSGRSIYFTRTITRPK